MKGLYNPRPVDDTPVNGQLAHGVTSNWAFDHVADLDAHTKNMLELYSTGQYLPSPLECHRAPGGAAIAANTLYAIPFPIARAITLDRLAINRVVAGAGGTKARLGVYANGTNLYPGALVVETGELAVDATGIVAGTINQSLSKGLYWLVVVSDGTPQLPTSGRYIQIMAFGQGTWYVAHTYGALPDPYTAGGTMHYRNWHIMLRISSLD